MLFLGATPDSRSVGGGRTAGPLSAVDGAVLSDHTLGAERISGSVGGHSSVSVGSSAHNSLFQRQHFSRILNFITRGNRDEEVC